MKKLAMQCSLFVVLGSGANAWAQPIVVERNGIEILRVNSGADIPINVGTINTDVLVHIYDDNGGAPSNSIGKVTISGSVQANSGARLNVLIAHRAQTNFPFDPNLPLDPGAVDFGGSSAGGLIVSNATLRDATRVTIAVSGDVVGTIDVAQVFRLQANGRTVGSALVGGNVFADITARAADGSPMTDFFRAIPHVRAAKSISGTILATGVDQGPSLDPLPGSIDQVVVFGPAADGISGDILAPTGTIEQIFCSGKIGTSSTVRSTITAGTRIGLITIRDATDLASPGDAGVLDKDIFADIDASAQNRANFASSFSLIETKGDYVGSLHIYDFAANLAWPHQRSSNRRGIFVGGDFIGDINVDFDYSHGDMIARSFRGDITIGAFLEGSIVAVGTEGSSDPLDGTIQSITVGFNEDYGPNFNRHGFSGKYLMPISTPPFEGVDRDQWYTQEGDLNDPAFLDSVIRADKRIGAVRIKAMSNQL